MILKKLTDPNEYFYFTLNNMIRIILIRNELFTKSSLCLSVNIGTDNDPVEMQGIGSLLKDAIFMRTDSNADDPSLVSNYVAKNGGKIISADTLEITTFYCDIENSHLEELANKFITQFVNPLLSEQGLRMAVKNVCSKFDRMRKHNDAYFRTILDKFSKEDDPRGKFKIENGKYLEKDNLREEVYKFWENNYSSDIMTLVIAGNHDMEVLKNIAYKFERIENKNKSSTIKIYGKEDCCFFRPDALRSIIKIKGTKKKNELLVGLSFPSEIGNLKKHAETYVMLAFEKKTVEILKNHLIEKGLIINIELAFKQLSAYGSLYIHFKLTKKGSIEYKTVLDTLVWFVKNVDLDELTYLEVIASKQKAFANHNVYPFYDNLASTISESMLKVPIENVLNHAYAYEEFSKDGVKYFMDYVSDVSRWIIVLSYPDLGNNTSYEDLNDVYDGVPYRIVGRYEPPNSDDETQGFDLKKCLKSSIKYSSDGYDELASPPKRFCREQLILNSLKLINKSLDRFSLFKEYDNGRIFFVYDQIFCEPKTHISVMLKNNDFQQSFYKYEMYHNVIYENFTRENNPSLRLNNIKFESSLTTFGIKIDFSGDSEKVIEYCKKYIKALKKGSIRNFEYCKENLLFKYANYLKLPLSIKTTDYIRDKISGLKSPQERVKELMNVDETEIQFFSEYYTEIIAVGNIEYDTIDKLFKDIKSTSENNELERKLESKVLVFPSKYATQSMSALMFKIINKNSTFKFGVKSFTTENMYVPPVAIEDAERELLKRIVIAEFLKLVLDTEIKHDLITREKFCSNACCEIIDIFGDSYIRLSLESDKSSKVAGERLNQFFASAHHHIKSMSLSLFQTFKNIQGRNWLYKPARLEALFNKMKMQYDYGYFDLSFSQKYLRILSEITVKDINETDILQDSHFVFSN